MFLHFCIFSIFHQWEASLALEWGMGFLVGFLIEEAAVSGEKIGLFAERQGRLLPLVPRCSSFFTNDQLYEGHSNM